MTRFMTRRQADVLEAIQDHWESRGFAPTVRELGETVGLLSSSSVWGHLYRLREQGRVTWEPGCPRTIREVS